MHTFESFCHIPSLITFASWGKVESKGDKKIEINEDKSLWWSAGQKWMKAVHRGKKFSSVKHVSKISNTANILQKTKNKMKYFIFNVQIIQLHQVWSHRKKGKPFAKTLFKTFLN